MNVPLIRNFSADSVFAYRRGAAISARQFLNDVTGLAALLPTTGHVVNLCADRYRFAVGFAAAIVRGQVNLLPPNQTPAILDELLCAYPDAHCLTDSADLTCSRTIIFPERLP